MSIENSSFDKKINSISNWLLILGALSFALLYFTLSFYTRPANEDVVFLSIIKNKNILEMLKWLYLTWTGRWASMFYFLSILFSTSDFQSIHYFIFTYYSVTFFILLYAINFLIRYSLSKFSNHLIDFKTSIAFSILFIAGFYFSTFQNIEVWWWIFASVDTLQGIVFLLLGTALLLNENKNKFHYFLICFCFIYIGGCYEIYALIVGTLFFILFLFLKKLKQFSSFKNGKLFKGFAIAIISLGISIIISFSAPGNFNRRTSYINSNSEEIKNEKLNTEITLTANDLFQKKQMIALSIASLWLLLGMGIKKNNEQIGNKKQLKKIILIFALPLLISVLITYLFQILILKDYQIPIRGWTFTSFSLFTFCCVLFFIIGYSINFSNSIFKNIFKIVLPFATFAILFFYFLREYQLTHIYAKEYDKLIATLIEAKNDTEKKTIFVNALPNAGMLMPFEIGTEYIDEPIKNILDLDYEIKLKE